MLNRTHRTTDNGLKSSEGEKTGNVLRPIKKELIAKQGGRAGDYLNANISYASRKKREVFETELVRVIINSDYLCDWDEATMAASVAQSRKKTFKRFDISWHVNSHKRQNRCLNIRCNRMCNALVCAKKNPQQTTTILFFIYLLIFLLFLPMTFLVEAPRACIYEHEYIGVKVPRAGSPSKSGSSALKRNINSPSTRERGEKKRMQKENIE